MLQESKGERKKQEAGVRIRARKDGRGWQKKPLGSYLCSAKTHSKFVSLMHLIQTTCYLSTYDIIHFSISCIQVRDRSLALGAETQSYQKKTDEVRSSVSGENQKKAIFSSKQPIEL